MNTQLTAKDKATVFAMYLGSEYSHETSVGTFSAVLTPMNYYDIYLGHERKNGKLHLYDISDITDEDAIEVAILDGYTASHPTELLIRFGKIAISGERGYLDFQVADYLRSKSYMLPYKGVNLFDAGIAIRKTKTITQ